MNLKQSVEYDPESFTGQIIQNALYLQSVIDRYDRALLDLNELVLKYQESRESTAFTHNNVIYKDLREFRDKFLGGPL